MSISRTVAVAVLATLLLGGCAGATERDGTADRPGGSMSPSENPPTSPTPKPTAAPFRTPGTTGPSLGGKPGDVVLTGKVELIEVEGGCLVLRVGQEAYQLMGVDRQKLTPGNTLTVRGRVRSDVATICQVGPVFEVSEVLAG